MTDQQNRQTRVLNQLGQGVSVAVALVLAVLLSIYLYYHDNQYTAPCQQPSNGVLDLRHAPLDNQSQPYHLHRDWTFYPDVWLKPGDDFSRYPSTLRSLHQNPSTLQADQGTYRLTLLLPDTPMSYALKLPSTSSAYRLYVNDDLILSENYLTTEDNHQKLFKDQILTIRTSGQVQLLLQYSNTSSMHNGLSAPPVFGRPSRVYSLAEYHQFFLGASVFLILLTLLLSISIYCRSRQSSNLAVILLCLSATAYLSYPLLRSEMLFSPYPWYQLRILFYFCCHAAAHWVYSLHFCWKDRLARFVRWYSVWAVFLCGIVLLTFFFLPREQGWRLFFGGVRLLQWGAILCGMALTLRMVMFGMSNRLMGAQSVTIWVFLLIDLVSPDFSPIISAQFPELGIITFMLLSILVEYMDVANAHHFRILYAQKITHAEQLLRLQERHYDQLASQVEDVRRIRHDLRQHLRVIQVLLEQGDENALSDYLLRYMETVQPLLTNSVTFYQVPIVDALVAYYWSAAQDRGAQFQATGQLHGLPQWVYVDFCSIVGNLLENALEALDRQAPGEARWIHMRCEILQQKLMVEVVNSNSAPVIQEEHRFLSTKRDEPGTGTLSVSLMARQYGGLASFSLKTGAF